MRIEQLSATEVLDSRGQPTLHVTLKTGTGVVTSAGVPSGASTGAKEAVELRDGDPARYAGRGVQQAAGSVTGPLTQALGDREWATLGELDAALCAADGTPNKSSLGANAIVGVSMAAARGFAAEAGQPLFGYLAAEGGGPGPRLPVPHFNVLNGGAHAANPLEFQEFMLAPLGAPSLAKAVQAGAEVYAALRRRLSDTGYATGLGDEGGFAPDIAEPAQACELLVEAIGAAGYTAGPGGLMLALDPAANGFFDAGMYRVAGASMAAFQLVEFYAELVDRFPIWSIEDGCAEDDQDGWQALTNRLGDRIQLVGDDNFVTHAATITAAAERGIANAGLIKLNQVGTVTETLAALAACRKAGYAAMVSHRSGETPDTFIADLAVGTGCGQLKSGAPARGERVAKYNRLLELAAAEPALPYGLAAGTRAPGG